jgi:two-component system sensor histidine kinase YesM
MIDGIEYQDEIGTLTSEFNRMSTRIKELINDVYIADIQKKDLELQQKKAQLSALQSQINPHFLFNVLETIRMRSYMKKEYETADIIESMARLLRNSYTWNKDWVTVQEEVKLIKSFLEIQAYRFGDKMKFEIDIDKKAVDCIVPNMIFIPFVENASNHGIEPLKGKGLISIKINCSNDQLRFTIQDNGAGMSKEKYEQILLSLKEEESIGENIGIKNVHYRLQLYYQNEFTFRINSSKTLGTTVEITIPCEKEGVKL